MSQNPSASGRIGPAQYQTLIGYRMLRRAMIRCLAVSALLWLLSIYRRRNSKPFGSAAEDLLSLAVMLRLALRRANHRRRGQKPLPVRAMTTYERRQAHILLKD